MEIIFDQIYFQLATVLFAITFFLVARKKIIFCTAIIPLLLPLYLVKIYFYPLIWLKSLETALESGFQNGIRLAINSLFALPERNNSVIRTDFDQIKQVCLPTNLLEITMLILVFWGVKIILKQLKKIYLEKSKNPLLMILLGFFSASFLSLFWAVNRATTLGVTKGWILLPILIFLLVLRLIRAPKFQKIFIFSLIFIGVFYIASSLLFLFTGVLTYDNRLAGIFLSPNHLAMVLVPSILIFSLKAILHREKISYFFIFLTSVSLLTLYYTYSYTSWLALGVGLAILLGYLVTKSDSKTRERIVRVSIPAAMFLAAFVLISQMNNSKLTSILNGDYYSSLNSRLMIWKSAVLIGKDRWLFGIGGGNFQSAYLDYQKYFNEPYEEWAVPEPHNIFLAFHLSLGVLGLISFFGILFYCAHLAFLFLREKANPLKSSEKDDRSVLQLWAILYLITFLITGLADTPYWKNDLSVIFWLSTAVIIGLKRS